MRAVRLPDGNLLIPMESIDPDDGIGLAEIGSEHPEFGRWCQRAGEGQDARGESLPPEAGA